jgi:hypothetical protein
MHDLLSVECELLHPLFGSKHASIVLVCCLQLTLQPAGAHPQPGAYFILLRGCRAPENHLALVLNSIHNLPQTFFFFFLMFQGIKPRAWPHTCQASIVHCATSSALFLKLLWQMAPPGWAFLWWLDSASRNRSWYRWRARGWEGSGLGRLRVQSPGYLA